MDGLQLRMLADDALLRSQLAYAQSAIMQRKADQLNAQSEVLLKRSREALRRSRELLRLQSFT